MMADHRHDHGNTPGGRSPDYCPPLRSAIRWLGSRHRVWDERGVAVLAGVAPDRARAYLTMLIERGAVIEDDGEYQAGPRYDEWSAQQVTALPGGSSARYRIRRYLRDAAWESRRSMRLTLARRVREAREAMGLTLRQAAEAAGMPYVRICRIEHAQMGRGGVAIRQSDLAALRVLGVEVDRADA
jgi:hypothetical protein